MKKKAVTVIGLFIISLIVFSSTATADPIQQTGDIEYHYSYLDAPTMSLDQGIGFNDVDVVVFVDTVTGQESSVIDVLGTEYDCSVLFAYDVPTGFVPCGGMDAPYFGWVGFEEYWYTMWGYFGANPDWFLLSFFPANEWLYYLDGGTLIVNPNAISKFSWEIFVGPDDGIIGEENSQFFNDCYTGDGSIPYIFDSGNDNSIFEIPFSGEQVIPEPSTIILGVAAIGGLSAVVRKRIRHAKSR